MRHLFVLFLIVVVSLAGVSAVVAADTSKPAANSKGPSCQGTLQVAGQNYPLKHVVAYETKVFDEVGIAVLLSDRPIAVDKLKAALKADGGSDDHFNVFQPHVKITFSKSGEASFCNAWAANTSISVSGSKLKGELAEKDGRVSGKASMDYGEEEAERKSGFELQFDAPLIVTPIAPPAKAVTKADDDEEKPAAGPAPHVRDLPIPKDAANVEFKELVEQIGFETSTDVKTTAKTFAKKLDELGWKSDGSDLITPNSSIVKRENGEASLTIFVKPAGKGSKVTIMASGLSWEERK